MTQQTDWLRGCATALVTPFKSDGSVDEKCLRDLVEYQIAGGIQLLVPCGTTGESATMTEEEDQFVIKTTVEVARGRAKVIAGTGSNSTAAAIEGSKRARELGADAVSGLPIVIYNVPGRTSSNISSQTALRLARDFENIAAVKEASGNLSQIMEILRDRPDGFKVLSGDDSMTLPIIALGGDGLISVASNEAPTLMSRCINLALDGDWNEARALHYRLLSLMEVNFIESSPGPVKAAMAMMGLLEENFRLPLVPIQDKSRARVREVLEELGLLRETTHAAAGTD